MSDPATICDPAARSYTALFVLLTRWSSGASAKEASGIDYPVNRVGQNPVECYTLAALVFFLMTGFFTVLIGDQLGAQLWSTALAIPMASLLTFVVLHLIFLGFALIYHCLKSVYFFSPHAPEQLPAGVYLGFFTLCAVGLVCSGNSELVAVAVPWLIWASLNFVAGLILFAEKFLSQLSGEKQ
ncbi:MAG: hypothetical protein GXP30_14600 [Verrucomicrobia bacterium]|nr:hypothetical protein [Verrucomicrobiota bacterium]